MSDVDDLPAVDRDVGQSLDQGSVITTVGAAAWRHYYDEG